MNWVYARRRVVFLGLALLLVADGTVYLGWIHGPAVPEADPARVEHLEREVAALADEVARLERVRAVAPRLQPKIEEFTSEHFLREGAGYSGLATDLEKAAADARVRLGRVAYAPDDELAQVQLRRVDITTAVEGEYTDLLRYLQALERSPRFYLINNLSLAEVRGGRVRLDLKLWTYLRART